MSVFNTSLSELKTELQFSTSKELLDICLLLARSKKENKELLTYHLFYQKNHTGFINMIKAEMENQFKTVNTSSLYLAKKTIRKIAKQNLKYINFSKDPIVTIEVSTDFCKKMNHLEIDYCESQTLVNLYYNQIKKISKAIETLHEDLQYDYQNLADELMQACRN